MTPLLEVRDLIVEFPTRRGVLRALDRVSFSIAAGEILGVVGESGAGTSLTGAAIVGLLTPPGRIGGGAILLDGERIDTLPAEPLRRIRGRRIGMIFQDPLTTLNPLLRIGRQLTETMRTHLDLTLTEARKRAIAWLERVGIPDAPRRIDSWPHEFSGGQRQRVVIALALCAEPELVIADEPTTALDVSVQAQIITLLKTLTRENGTSVMLVTHDMGVIAETADRVAVMYAGRIARNRPGRLGHPAAGPSLHGRLDGQHPNHRASRGAITPDRRLDASAERHPVRVRVPSPLRANVRSLHDRAAGTAARRRDPGGLLAARRSRGRAWLTRRAFWKRSGVTHDFDISRPFLQRALSGEPRRYLRAVNNVSFAIPRGTTLSLVGESGCGKSTIARLSVGLYTPREGEIRFEGMTLAEARKQGATRRQMNMIFQDPYASLNPRWTVTDIVAEPIRTFGLEKNESSVRRRVEMLLTQVGLSPADGDRYPHEFSGGQRQRVSIARALSAEPVFLVCDEPTSALDVSVQAQILNLMRDLQRRLRADVFVHQP